MLEESRAAVAEPDSNPHVPSAAIRYGTGGVYICQCDWNEIVHAPVFVACDSLGNSGSFCSPTPAAGSASGYSCVVCIDRTSTACS